LDAKWGDCIKLSCGASNFKDYVFKIASSTIAFARRGFVATIAIFFLVPVVIAVLPFRADNGYHYSRF